MRISFVVLLIVCAFDKNSNGAESAENLAHQFAGLPLAEKKIENLPKGREQEVIDALVKQLNRPLLLRLNHAPTVEAVISKHLNSNGKDAGTKGDIRFSASPYLIEKLAPVLYFSDELTRRDYGEGDGDWGESAAAAELIGQIVVKAPEFTPEVKAWAKKNIDHPGDHVIHLARRFWETNQAEIKAQRFGDVIVPTAMPLPAVTEPTGFETKPLKPAAASKATTPKKDSETPTTSEELFWKLPMVVLSLLLLLGYFLYRRNKGKS